MSAWAAALALCLTGASERSILGALERLDRDLARAESSLRGEEAARGHLQGEHAGLQSSLARARVQERRTWQRYRRRLRALSRLPGGARWVVLGGSGSLAGYLQTARLLRQVTAADRHLREQLRVDRQALDSLLLAENTRRQALENTIASLRQRRDALASDRRARAELLASVRAEKSKAAALAAERRAAQKRLRSMVSALRTREGPPYGKARGPHAEAPVRPGDFAKLDVRGLRGRFAHNRGRLPWPAAGPLRASFGQKVELAFGTVTAHNGWDIAAASGSRVQAVAAGEVVYAGWLRGYGQLVIVDHGDGYHAVAAHLGEVNVSVGDTVSAGQQIGTVGDTGSLRGTVLYFEIRHKGAPQDPRQWLRR